MLEPTGAPTSGLACRYPTHIYTHQYEETILLLKRIDLCIHRLARPDSVQSPHRMVADNLFMSKLQVSNVPQSDYYITQRQCGHDIRGERFYVLPII